VNKEIRMRVVGPFLLLLLVFLIGIPVWLRSPHSPGGRLFACVFGAMLIILSLAYAIGQIALLFSGSEFFATERDIPFHSRYNQALYVPSSPMDRPS
jgi:hypothetical protein